MFEQMVLVQERGSKKAPIRIHSENVEAAIDAGLYDLKDSNWEMPGGKLRRKLHPTADKATVDKPKKRRGRPPKKVEVTEPVESND